MGIDTEILGISETAYALLRDLVHDRTGLFFENGKRDLFIDKVSPLVIDRGFDKLLDYYFFLKYDAEAEREWKRLINALSIQETYFWRETDQIHAVAKTLVPQYFAALRGRPLRIWSAACATGEEPLSIAMALNEAGWFERAPIEIYASDASAAAIEKARLGLYRDRSLRSLPLDLRDKYFTREQNKWKVAAELHSRVRWRTINLLSEAEMAQPAASSIVFCRNVFIYFSEASIRRVVSMLAEHMPSPGYLFVAAAESLLRLTNRFELEEINGAFAYVKRD
ncbi:MAG TPA: protein-glutamate O-methyltransferase CheR [Blastocatellia bacterium]|nr:protein-glutamate O-methyltransferase CheR [Blastocatellia bacterium]